MCSLYEIGRGLHLRELVVQGIISGVTVKFLNIQTFPQRNVHARCAQIQQRAPLDVTISTVKLDKYLSSP